MTAPSTLIRKNPDGSEYRICGCGDHYTLPIPYDRANPRIRDLCPFCISEMQREQEDS
jgi:hydrogenase maturation factor HypF (carbamoyltransferase family)